MNPQKHNMAVLGQIVKLIPRKIIESLRKKHKIPPDRFKPRVRKTDFAVN